MKRTHILALMLLLMAGLFTPGHTYAQMKQKQVQYLSGTDNEHTVTWDFYCTGGRNSGYRTTIEVPSHWEQQGFGTYNYGRDYHTYGRKFKYADEKGMYKHEFIVPSDWKGHDVFIVFEGSMTDTKVKVNGKEAGPVHQGAFYEFRYNIADKLNYGGNNLLEVEVSKMSSNNSVNAAERRADYWIFGGIFRPVYLEAFPEEYIDRCAIVAKADGTLAVDIFPKNLKKKREIEAQITDMQGNTIASFSSIAAKDDSLVTLEHKVDQPKQWTAETPNLYKLKLSLTDGNKVLDETSNRFGFRTIEIRHGDGIYINGTKVKMKGINRHVWWPETGRCVNKGIDMMDVQLIKEMNMNAVRCSHYPPNKSFLNYCDSLGLFVIDELAGWQNYYDTGAGSKLVREMVIRDVNHPSVIFWSNGNEGGHNLNLDDDYAIYDPSYRPVIHAHHKPGHAFNGIDCNHYESYNSTKHILQDTLIYMTTEFLHSQNDGGGGAGLDDYWDLMYHSKMSGGGFIWALLDEGLVRTDLRNIIDVNGVNAPDGVLGPHREKEGSFYAIKDIYTPVYIDMKELPTNFKGEIPVENRYFYTNLNKCNFNWKTVKFRTPDDTQPGYEVVEEGTFTGTDLAPGQNGTMTIPLPADWKKVDGLLLTAVDPFGKDVYTHCWKIKNNTAINQPWMTISDAEKATIEEGEDSTITLTGNGVSVAFSEKTGTITSVKSNNSGGLTFNNGPMLVGGHADFAGMSHHLEGDNAVLEAKYNGDMKSAKWTMHKDGWLELEYEYALKGDYHFAGITFDYPEDFILSAKWLGQGPYRVWKNRMKGGVLNVWENAYNNTQTGYSPWIYPEFKGYFADVAWMEFNTVEGKFIMASKEDNLFVRLFDFYSLPGVHPHPGLPAGDISFLDLIPATGSKMSTSINARPHTFGPESFINSVDTTYHRTLYFYFGLRDKD